MADVILKNAQGIDTTYTDIDTLHIRNTSGGTTKFSVSNSIIKVAELPDLTVTCGTETKSTPSGNGGIVEFPVDAGTYTVTVKNGSTTVWTTTVTIGDYETIYAKGRVLNNLSMEDIHKTCEGGYAEHMFNIKDVRKFTEISASLFQGSDNNFFIAHFFKNGTKTEIQWMSCNCTNAGYQINPKFKWAGATDSAWTEIEASEGGWKYSYCRTNFMKTGDEIYTQAQSLKPDGATISDGTAWSDYKYSDTQTRAKFYTFEMVNPGTSTASDVATSVEKWTELSAWQAPTQNIPIFVKGYFVSVGTLSETNFNNGYFYTMASNVYTPATTYSSTTTYYGLYEYIHNDGAFYSALNSINSYLVDMELKQSPGKTRKNCITICNDKVTIPSLGEFMGQYIKCNKLVATSYSAPLYYGDAIIANEQFDGCDSDVWYLNQNCWSRSVYTNFANTFGYFSTAGGVNYNGVSYSSRLRASFRSC